MSSHIILRVFCSTIMIFTLIQILVVCGCLIGFFIQIRTLISRYLSYQLEFKSRSFPVVTISHLNPCKRDALANASTYFNEMMAAYSLSSASSSFGFSAARNGARQAVRRERLRRNNLLKTSIQLTTRAADYLFELSNDSIVNGTTNYEDPAYSYNDLVASCTYNAGDCNSTYFSSVNDPKYGRCIQYFNFIEPCSRAGPLYGLTMTIRTE
ncbi:hypothetical protein PRIPAC_82200 [Pristionchus pacificus]|uniref:Ion channel n=1 Tax=Pristionchus pacificus TaxID=54126 RepID=A0A2A6C335_PRIPA|nr:hypothetical protein PRIPAC_82200 [Pristionchus pacificus]|eukprot:PDM72642.1 ion channel [Pristionchus pacificus]